MQRREERYDDNPAERPDRAQYEVEVAGLDEFVRLLGLKVKEPGTAKQSPPHRAVCMPEMRDTRTSEMGIASVKRYVRAVFV